MRFAVLAQNIPKLLIPGLTYILLTACSGGGGSTSIGGGSGGFILGGSVGDGPIVSATITVKSLSGTILGTTVSSETAHYSISLSPGSSDFPLIIETTGGVDLVTESSPDFNMVSVVLDSSQTRANINPHSTLIVKSAQAMSGGLSNVNIVSARNTILNKLNFGIDTSLDPVTSPITGSNIAMIVKSSETLAEMIRRARDTLGGGITADQVVAALAADLSDGDMDGAGSVGAIARTSAVANVVSAQVLLEALNNNLKVGGIRATNLMDDAIRATLPNAPLSAVTDNVRVTAEMREQAITAINAAIAMDAGVDLTTIASALSGISAGDLPADISVFQSSDLDTSVSLVTTANDSQIASINTVSSGSNPPANSPPTIGGAPVRSVSEGNSYSFTPSAGDTDGDALVFSISNKPSWASFNASNGALTGTPGFSDAGTYSTIVISVSDNVASASLGAFNITVVNTNVAPVISGTPGSSIAEGSFYSFTPGANDVDGDALVFSISNKPSWASFNTSNGALTGTPGFSDAGTYSTIVISVSDSSVTTSLDVFSITVSDTANNTNRPPTISGSPGTSVTEGSPYSFTPSASDADGNTLTFSISSKPAWADFNTSTGALTGTPGVGDIAVYNGITILVSDGTATAVLRSFTIDVVASSRTGAATLSWMPPTTRTDGTGLDDLSGYKIYYGTSSGSYTTVINIANAGVASYVVENLSSNTYYFVVTAINSAGVESEFSGQVSKTIL